MPFPNEETQFQKGQSGNPAGRPKGAISLSTRIQNMLNDERFTPENVSEFVDTPMAAIIATAIKKSSEGDAKWAKWLSDAGYGQKIEMEHSGEIGQGNVDPQLADQFNEFVKNNTIGGK